MDEKFLASLFLIGFLIFSGFIIQKTKSEIGFTRDDAEIKSIIPKKLTEYQKFILNQQINFNKLSLTDIKLIFSQKTSLKLSFLKKNHFKCSNKNDLYKYLTLKEWQNLSEFLTCE